MGSAKVFELETLADTARSLRSVDKETENHCAEGMDKAEKLLCQAQEELPISEGMLNAARAEEALKLARQLKADARMAQAVAEEAAALAGGNPLAIAAASVEVAAAGAELAEATEEYQNAVSHRERLEHRYELAWKCVSMAQETAETLRMRFQCSRARLSETITAGNARIWQAYEDLSRYLARMSPAVKAEIKLLYEYEPEENKPITPKDVHSRLNAGKGVVNAVLEYLYCTDLKFRGSVDGLCAQLKIPGEEAGVATKIKKNIVGRLSEELVIRCFAPMGDRVETQGRFYLEEGSYTKADLILYGLKEPLILGRGEGMGARKGGNLGIEVKSGYKEYLFAQLSHMQKQARGHAMCDISCTICTRDITSLPPEKEQLLRTKLREAGSPIIGMLPYKAELDKECIEFVRAKAEKKNV